MVRDFILNTIFGWIGVAGLICIACVVVGIYFPSLRKYAIALAAIAVSFASIYSKGWQDHKAREDAKKERAVRKIEEEYNEINSRPDDVDAVIKRLRNNGF